MPDLITIGAVSGAAILFFWDSHIAPFVSGFGKTVVVPAPKPVPTPDLTLPDLTLPDTVTPAPDNKVKTHEKDEVLEAEDQRAIAHLRKRASQLGEEQLIEMVKKIDAAFYDIHVLMNLEGE